MQAFLEREALPAAKCSHCAVKLGRWRCRDCMFPTLQCRKCMRELHQHEPLHRIECWTGKFFRPAAMWEVGGYILIRHCGELTPCETLQSYKKHLDDIQIEQDNVDQRSCHAAAAAVNIPDSFCNDNETIRSTVSDENNYNKDKRTDDLILAEMDRLNSQRLEKGGDEVDEILQEDDDEAGEKDCDNEAMTGFSGYLKTADGTVKSGAANADTANAGTANLGAAHSVSSIWSENAPEGTVEPRKDALNNLYTRIAHSNGIHHLAVITCSCRGVGRVPIDLMYSRLVPTSFSKIRTLFTTMALDTFRLANLEMKASAYQYFELIHRLTSKTTSNVPDLYSDLRKVSRAWRWMKKLKWAGFGHKTADATRPAAGELTVFCPACPQPNVNLPSNWKDDPNRYYCLHFCSKIY